jgi:hypothetical protein
MTSVFVRALYRRPPCSRRTEQADKGGRLLDCVKAHVGKRHVLRRLAFLGCTVCKSQVNVTYEGSRYAVSSGINKEASLIHDSKLRACVLIKTNKVMRMKLLVRLSGCSFGQSCENCQHMMLSRVTSNSIPGKKPMTALTLYLETSSKTSKSCSFHHR